MKELNIPSNVDKDEVENILKEAQEKLDQLKPKPSKLEYVFNMLISSGYKRIGYVGEYNLPKRTILPNPFKTYTTLRGGLSVKGSDWAIYNIAIVPGYDLRGQTYDVVIINTPLAKEHEIELLKTLKGKNSILIRTVNIIDY